MLSTSVSRVNYFFYVNTNETWCYFYKTNEISFFFSKWRVFFFSMTDETYFFCQQMKPYIFLSITNGTLFFMTNEIWYFPISNKIGILPVEQIKLFSTANDTFFFYLEQVKLNFISLEHTKRYFFAMTNETFFAP